MTTIEAYSFCGGPGDESAVREIFNSHRPFTKILTLSDDISRGLQPES